MVYRKKWHRCIDVLIPFLVYSFREPNNGHRAQSSDINQQIPLKHFPAQLKAVQSVFPSIKNQL